MSVAQRVSDGILALVVAAIVASMRPIVVPVPHAAAGIPAVE
jgi:hypothetical protein